MAATYASGTVRARRWHGDGDVRGYRPPRGWTARADLTDLHPSRAAPCRAPCGGSSKPRNNEPHRPQAVPPWGRWSNSGRGGGRARFHCSAKRPIAAFGQAAMGPRTRALVREIHEASKCGGASRRQRFDRAPPQWAGLVWLRPGLLRQVARKRAVPDAGGSLSVRHEGRFTDTPPSLASMELPHHASDGRELRQGRSGLVVGALTWPASGRSRCSRHAGMPSWPRLHSGAGGLCVLVLL
jgi:hypothetical protein